ncbi:MAG TPA: ATP synthase F1 subunit delta [Anaerolineae bacterium]|jgi:F-type H+-transporting ATPase subunit delta|nr:ATP synthase F1 subunit delta [Anaerolineae bacterium]
MVDTEATSSSLTARVSSAVPLTDEEQAALGEKLKARFGQALNLRFEVEPSLLGGVRVRVGDEVIDGSVKSKLDALAQSLAQSR